MVATALTRLDDGVTIRQAAVQLALHLQTGKLNFPAGPPSGRSLAAMRRGGVAAAPRRVGARRQDGVRKPIGEHVCS